VWGFELLSHVRFHTTHTHTYRDKHAHTHTHPHARKPHLPEYKHDVVEKVTGNISIRREIQ
jgi:hypothetical protein